MGEARRGVVEVEEVEEVEVEEEEEGQGTEGMRDRHAREVSRCRRRLEIPIS